MFRLALPAPLTYEIEAVSDQIPTLSGPALLLSEGGAHHQAPFASLEGFRLALRLGATSLGAKGWLTKDGELALAKDDTVGMLRRRRISSIVRSDLPEVVPTLDQLLDAIAPDVILAVSLVDDEAFDAALGTARAHGATDRLWIRHDDPEVLGAWRQRSDDVHLVNTVRIPALKDGAERRAATLRSLGVEGLEARHTEWSGGLVALMHRFRRHARATDANYPEVLAQLFRMGLDSIGGDHPDRLADAAMSHGLL
jgi:glycerophosphoryl diester phosphodiesterase